METVTGLGSQGGVQVTQVGVPKMLRHLVSSKGVALPFFDLPKVSKIPNISSLAQSKQSSKKQPSKKQLRLPKVSKMTTNFLNCSNSAK